MDTATLTPSTTFGTPASPKWDAEWLAEVDRVETELGHRICGAHTPAWTPCKLKSNHTNGRCRFHGGAPGIGAAGGNRNAWIHGLYSRRLQHCGDHCPLWQHCPMAGKDVLFLKPDERPLCVYEQEEFDSILSTFSLEKEKVEPKEINIESDGDPVSVSLGSTFSFPKEKVDRDSASPREPNLIERNVALFQVMLTRAQAALSFARLTDDTSAHTPNYQMHSTKVSALVQAQLAIARELRHWLKLLPDFAIRPKSKAATASPSEDPKPEGLPMRMMKILEETDGFIEEGLGLGPDERSPFSPGWPRRRPPDPQPFPA